MSELSKVALQVDSNQSFPNNNNGYITPAILRSYNTNVIDSTVNQTIYTADSGSWNAKIGILNGQTGSYVTTGSNTFTGNQRIIGEVSASTFVGDGSGITNVNQSPILSLNAYTQSQDTKNLTLATYTGSNDTKWTTLGSTTSSFSSSIGQLNAFTQSTDTKFTTLGYSTSSLNAYTASNDTKWSTMGAYTQSQDTKNITLAAETASLTTEINRLAASSASQATKNATLATYTSSIDTKFTTLGTYTASVDTKFTTIGLLTGSYATTGSNTFIGIQTLQDTGLNATSIVSTSGSLMLVAKSFTSASAHLSASTGTGVNLIFKNNSSTGDTIISGSNNIFVNPDAATTGFKRYFGNGNITLDSNQTLQMSASMAFSPVMNGNNIQAQFNLRGPVSASTYTISNNTILGNTNFGSSDANNFEKIRGVFTFSQNLNLGTVTVIANKEIISGSTAIQRNVWGQGNTMNVNSSSVTIGTNNINGSTINNNYFSGSAGNGLATCNNSFLNLSTINFEGQNPSGATNQPVVSSVIAGNATLHLNPSTAPLVGTATRTSIANSIMWGSGLIVTGSSIGTATQTLGSAFFGRFNAQNGNRSKTGETVFAVGTGTGTGASLKTGFLIDSGSNTFVEGTLTVSGGVYQNVVPITIASSTASLDLTQGTYFTLTLADNTTTHIRPTNLAAGVSATLVITTGTNSTASLAPILLQPLGNSYNATSGSGKIDVLSLTSTNASNMFVVSAKNMI